MNWQRFLYLIRLNVLLEIIRGQSSWFSFFVFFFKFFVAVVLASWKVWIFEYSHREHWNSYEANDYWSFFKLKLFYFNRVQYLRNFYDIVYIVALIAWLQLCQSSLSFPNPSRSILGRIPWAHIINVFLMSKLIIYVFNRLSASVFG